MDIEKLFTEFAKNMAKTVLNKKEESTQINLDNIGSTDILEIIMKRLVHDGDYNRAENMLFEEINKNHSKKLYNIALDFYNLLLEKSDKELKVGNFTREEIYQGLQDLNKIYGK
ncbi:MAG: hypothetical protein K0R54_2345 [Clostridiaceae bacterium]|jgi:ubiquitin C-terminal hydrolase|nr:hypothetical protein [Clostridiaceae bacterium]